MSKQTITIGDRTFILIKLVYAIFSLVFIYFYVSGKIFFKTLGGIGLQIKKAFLRNPSKMGQRKVSIAFEQHVWGDILSGSAKDGGKNVKHNN